MSRGKRSLTPEERLSLLQEAEGEGYMEVLPFSYTVVKMETTLPGQRWGRP
jgi:hypothetical protein